MVDRNGLGVPPAIHKLSLTQTHTQNGCSVCNKHKWVSPYECKVEQRECKCKTKFIWYSRVKSYIYIFYTYPPIHHHQLPLPYPLGSPLRCVFYNIIYVRRTAVINGILTFWYYVCICAKKKDWICEGWKDQATTSTITPPLWPKDICNKLLSNAKRK